MYVIVVIRTLICTWLLAALAVPTCCCSAEAWGKAAKSSAKAHSCCGGPERQEGVPATPACDCGCSHDLLTQATPVVTADCAGTATWGAFAAPACAVDAPEGPPSVTIALACHDPPGIGTLRFLIFRNFRC